MTGAGGGVITAMIIFRGARLSGPALCVKFITAYVRVIETARNADRFSRKSGHLQEEKRGGRVGNGRGRLCVGVNQRGERKTIVSHQFG